MEETGARSPLNVWIYEAISQRTFQILNFTLVILRLNIRFYWFIRTA